jgi:hypothetical protein
MKTTVRRGALVLIALGALGVACSSRSGGSATGQVSAASSVTDLRVTPSASSQTCPTPFACFDVRTDGANITHIFVDVDAPCASNPSDFSVEVNGVPVTDLHTQGGPCTGGGGNGPIDRDVWFPLMGNQSQASVCVFTHGFVASQISVGAKAQDDCVAASSQFQCQVCQQQQDSGCPQQDAGQQDAGQQDAGQHDGY